MPKAIPLSPLEAVTQLKEFIKLPIDPSLRKLLRKTVTLIQSLDPSIPQPTMAERVQDAD